jgi:hypothetical protein
MVTQANLAPIYAVNLQCLPGGSAPLFWTSYSSSATLAAFQNAAALGFNTVRIYLLPSTFGFPTPSSPLLAHLTDACNQAVIAGVKLHITLIWFWSPIPEFGQVTGTKTFMTALMGAVLASSLPVTNSLATTGAFFETYNEGRYGDMVDNYAGTYDGGYTGSTTPPQTVATVVTTWSRIIVPWLRTLPTSAGGGGFTNATNCLVTLSCTNAGGILGHTDDLTAAVSAFSGTQIPDWYEWHSYPGSAASQLTTDMTAAITAINSTAPLFIGETGSTVRNGPNQPRIQLQNARHVAQSLGLGEPAPFVLYDLGGAPLTDTWGMYDINGVARPAVSLYQNLPPGTPVPAL